MRKNATKFPSNSSIVGQKENRFDLDRLGIPTLERVVARYCEKTSRDAIQDLDWYFAFNLFRLLGIAQGIKKRLMDGNASSARAGELADRIPQIAAQAWRFAERAGA